MKLGIFGSGMVGQALAAKLAALGHEVMVSTREAGKLQAWLATVEGSVSVGTVAETAVHGDILFNATNGFGTIAALTAAGEANLNGKILIDITNPLDFSQGMPPSLFVVNTDSLGEQIQRAFPGVRVVKTLNTVAASLMVNPRQLADGDHTLFISGNDADAKAQVVTMLRDWFGWRDVLDMGDITTARGSEMYLALWIRLMQAMGTPMFSLKIVR